MKPYQKMPIQECDEPLVAIPLDCFAVVAPHPYQALGAPYGTKSPFYVRQGVLTGLINAQTELQHRHPGWRIQIFDAYRPISVQKFMVDFTFAELVSLHNLTAADLTETQRQAFLEQVYQFWAAPSLNPETPPPHSTGAAVDVTLVDATGSPVDMGSPIDEISPRSYPDHFAGSTEPGEIQHHAHRQLLAEVISSAGFQRHPNEWWHFSCGDQMWAWLCSQQGAGEPVVARYGRVE
ncbi:M15 family metallopeptidase [Microcoleus sp. FACHB-672]|uniref:M15 family metallopeptidase n=1 Tax=Microcoleus sp. FACHB-672 TaxID=2692825 RepID=UPI002814B387|nr:M15 family metallopeptidase [Microcoleus sp. FACHB-672]